MYEKARYFYWVGSSYETFQEFNLACEAYEYCDSIAKEFNDNHKFDVLGGFTWQKYQLESYYSGTEGFANDVTQFNNLALGDPARNEVNSGYNSFQLVSWLARANYTLKNKYLVTLVSRVDGSSRFAGSKNEYAFFPSAALAWRLIEEPWIQNLN